MALVNAKMIDRWIIDDLYTVILTQHATYYLSGGKVYYTTPDRGGEWRSAWDGTINQYVVAYE